MLKIFFALLSLTFIYLQTVDLPTASTTSNISNLIANFFRASALSVFRIYAQSAFSFKFASQFTLLLHTIEFAYHYSMVIKKYLYKNHKSFFFFQCFT